MYVVLFILYDDVRVEGVCDTHEDAEGLVTFLTRQQDNQYGQLKEGSWRNHFEIRKTQKFSHDHIFALVSL